MPAGYRNNNGSDLRNRGNNVFYWSSSVYSAANAWRRNFNYSRSDANRNNNNRSNGFSVRCVRESRNGKGKGYKSIFFTTIFLLLTV